MKVFLERGITHLDLHGVKHAEAHQEILDFVYQYQDSLPLIIICGNSNKMIEVAARCLESSDITFSSPRFGLLRIEKIS